MANPGDHTPAKLRESIEASLKALAPHKIRVFFLHVPDRSVPYEETLRGVNELYKEGLLCVIKVQLTGTARRLISPPARSSGSATTQLGR